ncbi:MAG: trehalose-phosphatase [Oligoflexia bacterium]|nr:trehalose-phosphatase [Oligoflexia bacterium]
MTHLLSDRGLRILDEFVAPRTLYAFDYDGTLVPIVDSPEKARLSPETEGLLMQLRARAPVAVLSGRSVADLRSRIPCEVDVLVGNHGLEGIPGGPPVASLRAACVRWLRELEPLLSDLREPGVWLEDKGLTLSVHYRDVIDSDGIARVLRERLEGILGEGRIIPGKRVFNLVPERRINKGIALLRVMERFGARKAFFIGDDVTDEDVFALADGRVIGVRVEAAPFSRASLFLRSQQEVSEALRIILQRYSFRI